MKRLLKVTLLLLASVVLAVPLRAADNPVTLVVLTRDNGYSSIAVSSTEKSCELSQKSGTDLYFMYINWVVPDKYRGKRCRFSWYVHKHGNKSANEKEIKLTPTYV